MNNFNENNLNKNKNNNVNQTMTWKGNFVSLIEQNQKIMEQKNPRFK